MISLIQTISDPANGSIFTNLLEHYGPLGIGLGVLLTLMMRQNKAAQNRIENLETLQQSQHSQHLSDQKEMINDYVELVQNNTKVISDLTACLNAIKSTLEHLERKER